MADRRTARGTRLLDPVWHQMRDAFDKLYAEVEPGAVAGGLAVTVANPDGTVVTYSVTFTRPGVVERHLITDGGALLDAMGAASIDATIEEG